MTMEAVAVLISARKQWLHYLTHLDCPFNSVALPPLCAACNLLCKGEGREASAPGLSVVVALVEPGTGLT